MNIKSKITLAVLAALFLFAISSCSAKKSCSKKGKTKVEMGWM